MACVARLGRELPHGRTSDPSYRTLSSADGPNTVPLNAPTTHGQEGAILIFVLIFVTIFGVLVAGLLTISDANIRTTGRLKSHDARVYAADGGVDYAIQTLQTNPTSCPDVLTGQMALAPIVINGRTVNVTCQTTAGISNLASRWAVMTKDSSGTSLSVSNAANTTKFVTGPVYNAGATDLKAALEVDKGNFSQYQPGATCTLPSVNLTFGSGGYAAKCTALTPVAADPSPKLPCLAGPCPGGATPVILPPHVDALNNPTGQPDLTVGSCSIFKPGKYTVAPVLNTSATGSNYFASGIYYFENIGNWTIDSGAVVFAGKQDLANGEPKKLTQTPCANDAAVGVNDNTGAEFIFGGTSQLEVKNGHFEIFFRSLSGSKPEGSAGIGIRTIPPSPPGGYIASSPGLASSIVIDNGANPDFATHGLVYSPNTPVIINATNNTGARFLAGVVAFDLTIGVAEPADGFELSIPNPVPRTVSIISTAKGVSGEQDIVTRAVVDIPNDPAQSPVVDSWNTVYNNQ